MIGGYLYFMIHHIYIYTYTHTHKSSILRPIRGTQEKNKKKFSTEQFLDRVGNLGDDGATTFGCLFGDWDAPVDNERARREEHKVTAGLTTY